MSTNSDVLRASELLGRRLSISIDKEAQPNPAANRWNPEAFAREQIRTLVRRVFLNSATRQVVFCSAASNRDLAHVCEQVGQTLARETTSDVAIVVQTRDQDFCHFSPQSFQVSVKSLATQLDTNLWQLPAHLACQATQHSEGDAPWLSLLSKLRKEFEYSVIEGPVAGISSEAELLGGLADGVILVLGAHSDRRASVRKVKELLEAGHSKILGTVLSGRSFPIPERIYRRL